MATPDSLNPGAEVPSPCTGVCRVGGLEHCVGCGRSLDEITVWGRAGRAERLAIRARAAARLLEFPEPEDAQ